MMKNKKIIIIGPGRMGLGIGLAFAFKNAQVKIIDGKQRSFEEYGRVEKKAREELYSNLKFLKKVGYLKGDLKRVISNISFSYGINKENLEGDFIFEAIPEKPDLKIELFKKISPYVHREAVLASTTSTININTLKKGFIHPDKLLITHWLNPAFIIPLVEIAFSSETDPRSIEHMKNLLKRIGKVPVVLKDSPGFIIPRIQAVAMNEAVRILEEGVATPEDIDRAIKTGFGFRLCAFGLLEFIDMGGLDILYYADDFLHSAFKSERFKVPKLIKEKMEKGETGPRTGKGIYEYKDVEIKTLFERKYRDLIKLLRFVKG
ncbi:MAG: hypothetical protein A2V86_13100 [Deltaproteobacteria bacterium RBG_16_49_23]|nr:MAG: hypothetical protein A2V86_13100 [Deltaproteobacteria bacterium RBG_16_49_23]